MICEHSVFLRYCEETCHYNIVFWHSIVFVFCFLSSLFSGSFLHKVKPTLSLTICRGQAASNNNYYLIHCNVRYRYFKASTHVKHSILDKIVEKTVQCMLQSKTCILNKQKQNFSSSPLKTILNCNLILWGKSMQDTLKNDKNRKCLPMSNTIRR